MGYTDDNDEEYIEERKRRTENIFNLELCDRMSIHDVLYILEKIALDGFHVATEIFSEVTQEEPYFEPRYLIRIGYEVEDESEGDIFIPYWIGSGKDLKSALQDLINRRNKF